MQHFCTLFDSNYLAKGVTMHKSLLDSHTDFHLYIFAFDEISYTILTSLTLENVTVISLAEFEDHDLLRVKPSRSRAEYCWTCTPSIIQYCLNHFGLDHCVYLDADLYFYSDSSCLLEECASSDVMITGHRYTPQYDQSSRSGIYCVQFMYFRNTENGRYILNWWRNACIEWCYNRIEDGRFGDQKYLDDWTTRFHGVHVLTHPGGGVAPWNVQQYEFSRKANCIRGNLIGNKKIFDLVFYHFHHLNHQRIRFIEEFNLGPYKLSRTVRNIIYRPYMLKLNQCNNRLKELFPGSDYLGTTSVNQSVPRFLGHLIKNYFKRNKYIRILPWQK